MTEPVWQVRSGWCRAHLFRRHVWAALAVVVVAVLAIILLPGRDSMAADDVVSHAGIRPGATPGPTWRTQ